MVYKVPEGEEPMKLFTGYTIKFFKKDQDRIREAAAKEYMSPIPWIRQKILQILDKTEEND